MIFSLGREIDNTIMKGKETLFVHGWQPRDEILSRAFNNKLNHIHFTNFDPGNRNQYNLWAELLQELLEVKTLFVSLEFTPNYCPDIINMECNNNENFIPILNFIIPDLAKYNENTCFKINDKYLTYSNDGIFSGSIDKMARKTYFEPYIKYTNRAEIL
tara:strand:+ start:9135 stop:9611 length:477 start_codon:yes stop_codon:yes gene_type:complete